MLKEIGLRLHFLLTPPHPIVSAVEGTYVLRNQQTCTFDNRNLIKGGPIFDDASL